MAKLRKEFEIMYPLKTKAVRDLKIVIEHIGNLVVSGIAYCDPSILPSETNDRIKVDIDFIKWNGANIKPVLEVAPGIEEIELYCIKETSKLFPQNSKEVA